MCYDYYRVSTIGTLLPKEASINNNLNFWGCYLFYVIIRVAVGGRYFPMVGTMADTHLMLLRAWGSIPLPTAPKPSLVEVVFGL